MRIKNIYLYYYENAAYCVSFLEHFNNKKPIKAIILII